MPDRDGGNADGIFKGRSSGCLSHAAADRRVRLEFRQPVWDLYRRVTRTCHLERVASHDPTAELAASEIGRRFCPGPSRLQGALLAGAVGTCRRWPDRPVPRIETNDCLPPWLTDPRDERLSLLVPRSSAPALSHMPTRWVTAGRRNNPSSPAFFPAAAAPPSPRLGRCGGGGKKCGTAPRQLRHFLASLLTFSRRPRPGTNARHRTLPRARRGTGPSSACA